MGRVLCRCMLRPLGDCERSQKILWMLSIFWADLYLIRISVYITEFRASSATTTTTIAEHAWRLLHCDWRFKRHVAPRSVARHSRTFER